MRAVLHFVVIALLASTEAIACDCSKDSYDDGNATVVFAGEITRVEGPDSTGATRVSFKVLELQRGQHSEVITILVSRAWCNPDAASFKVGDRYQMAAFKLVAAASGSDEARADLAINPLYFNHYCSLRKRLPVTPNTSLERTRGR
jgi:hypothetical protein